MGRLFGTDGVRGIANEELTPQLAMQLGQAGAYVLSKENARGYAGECAYGRRMFGRCKRRVCGGASYAGGGLPDEKVQG